MAGILLVDDERAVLGLAKLILERTGHHVLCASNGIEGLQVFHSYPEAIDIVVSDVDMPQMNGAEMAARIRATHPSTPIILMSGYLPETATGAPASYPFIQKPFRPETLIEAVKRLVE